MLRFEEIKKVLGKYKGELKEKFHIKEIGIFGSYVRGEGAEKSDIDILVEFEKGNKDFFNYIKLKYYLKELLGKEVDIVIKEAVKPRLKEKIFSEVRYV
ncbi:MAG TPA: nucleotidyltransferase [Candidatus Omnitrophica bacterium]|nr:nucleotidyltransferase [Candidatus Omnitrophota bacterium]